MTAGVSGLLGVDQEFFRQFFGVFWAGVGGFGVVVEEFVEEGENGVKTRLRGCLGVGRSLLVEKGS